MLLRSSSAPILSSLLLYSKDSSPEPEHILQLHRTISVSSQSPNFADIDLQNSSSPKRKNLVPRCNLLKNQHCSKIKERKEVKDLQQKTCMKAKPSIKELFSSSGAGKKDNRLQTLVMDGGNGSNGGGRGSDGGHGRAWDFPEGNNHGRDRTDSYYQNMIEANPGDALLLGNYAKFLKEVHGDLPKAAEYLERAILANPGGDGHILSLYADLIWQTEKNADRAEGYFDQAIKTAPDDCYVMASYAKFLWDAEDEEDKDCQTKSDYSHAYPTDLIQEFHHLPPLTAGS